MSEQWLMPNSQREAAREQLTAILRGARPSLWALLILSTLLGIVS